MTTPAATPPADAALQTFLDLKQLKLDVEIDSTDIIGALARQPGLYLHYANLAVAARRQHERYKSVLEILESQLNNQHRERLNEEYEMALAADDKSKAKAPTEGQVRAAVVSDTKYKALVSRVIDAQQIFKLCDAAENAMHMRKDMLNQIARLAGNAGNGGEGPMRVHANRQAKASAGDLMTAVRRNAGLPAEEETT